MTYKSDVQDELSLVRVAQPNGEFVEVPCCWRKGGLAVALFSDGVASVTHESSGAAVWKSGRPKAPKLACGLGEVAGLGGHIEAVAVATACLTLPVDWTKDMESVRAQVAADEYSASFIAALVSGRVQTVYVGEVEAPASLLAVDEETVH